MKKYTLEGLKELNRVYDYNNAIREADVVRVNELVEIIEKSRNVNMPKVGDIVDFTDSYGNYSSNAHIEECYEDELHINEHPYIPFVDPKKNGEISTSTSGGPFHHIPKDLKYIGKKEKAFKVCTNIGAIEFYATVNVWSYSDGVHEFTTKDYDVFNITIDEERTHFNGYKYSCTQNGMNSHAFYTDEEYQAWIKTFCGVEKPGNWSETQRIVWTYKQINKCVPLEEYLAIENAVVDSTLCNGKIQECKRIYKGTTVETILPYQRDMIILEGEKCYMRAYK